MSGSNDVPQMDFFRIEFSPEEGGGDTENPDFSHGADPLSQKFDTDNIKGFELHTNFDLSRDILESIEYTPGIEIVKFLSPYRAFVCIGTFFEEEETQKLVRENVSQVIRGEDIWEMVLEVLASIQEEEDFEEEDEE